MIKGYIYKISCKSENINKCYIGSTTNFYRRVAQHKYDINRQGNRPIYKFINSNGGMDNFNFEKILEVQINERIDLFKIEKQYIKSESNLINCSIPCRNKKEYYNDNKNILIQKSKDYYYKYRHMNGGWKGTLKNSAGWTSVEVAGKVIDKIGPILATKYIEVN